MKFLEFFAALLTVAGLYLISGGLVTGWLVAMAGNLAWIVWGYKLPINARYLITLNTALFFIALKGFYYA